MGFTDHVITHVVIVQTQSTLITYLRLQMWTDVNDELQHKEIELTDGR